MSRCRCSDIRRKERDLNRLQLAKYMQSKYQTKKQNVDNKLITVAVKAEKATESDYVLSNRTLTNSMADDMDAVLSSILSQINHKMDEIRDELEDLKEEDEDYHDDEDDD